MATTAMGEAVIDTAGGTTVMDMAMAITMTVTRRRKNKKLHYFEYFKCLTLLLIGRYYGITEQGRRDDDEYRR